MKVSDLLIFKVVRNVKNFIYHFFYMFAYFKILNVLYTENMYFIMHYKKVQQVLSLRVISSIMY